MFCNSNHKTLQKSDFTIYFNLKFTSTKNLDKICLIQRGQVAFVSGKKA